MKYYLCIKEKEEQNTNWFINYTFYSNSSSTTNGHHSCFLEEFSLGHFYNNRDANDNVVFDNNGNLHNIDDVREYLEDFDFVIDERVSKIIENKKKRLKLENKEDDFNVSICPFSKVSNDIRYLITCRYTHNGSVHVIQNMNVSQYDGVIVGLRMMRKSDNITRLWQKVLHNHIKTLR